MKTIFATIALTVFLPVYCLASGWHDYELDIGDGYKIYRNNSYDVSVGDNGGIIFSPYDYNKVGPIWNYSTTNNYIFLKTIGLTGRLQNNDSIPHFDLGTENYFIVDKSNNDVIGPLTRSELISNKYFRSSKALEWRHPKNPNILLPLFWDIIFVVISIPLLVYKFPFEAIGVLVCLVAIVFVVMKIYKHVRFRIGQA